MFVPLLKTMPDPLKGVSIVVPVMTSDCGGRSELFPNSSDDKGS